MLAARLVISLRAPAWQCRYRPALMRTQLVIDATRRGRNPAVAIFPRAALVTSWAVIPGLQNSCRHFASVLVTRSIKKLPATNVIRSGPACRNEDKSQHLNR